MSYILQALKKSEQERQELNSSFRPKEDSSSAEAIAAGSTDTENARDVVISSALNRRVALLISSVLLLLIAAVYLNKNPEVESVAGVENDAKSIEKVLIKVSKLTELAFDKEISPKIDGSVPAAEVAATKKVGEKSQETDQSASITNESQTIRPKLAVEQASKNIQSLIPTLEISSHIYSSLAVRRSIVVNGERLVEGDFISPEIQVKEITQQGMIIDVNDWPLVVSRSRGWSP